MRPILFAIVLFTTLIIMLRVYSGKSKKDSETANPPTVEELGRSAWTWLHSMAGNYPDNPSLDDQKAMNQLIHHFARFYPCSECKAHLLQDLKTFPAVTDSRRTLEHWLCRLHNNVNKRLNKDPFDCSMISYRWRSLDGCSGKCSVKPKMLS